MTTDNNTDRLLTPAEVIEQLDHLAGCGAPTPVSDDWLAGVRAAHDHIAEWATDRQAEAAQP